MKCPRLHGPVFESCQYVGLLRAHFGDWGAVYTPGISQCIHNGHRNSAVEVEIA